MGYKLIVGITAPQSVVLIRGQLSFFQSNGYETYLLAPDTNLTRDFCEEEGVQLVPITIKREISPLNDVITLIRILKALKSLSPDIVNFGTPKVSLLGLTAARLLGVPKRIYTCRGFRFEHESGYFRRLLIVMEKITSRMSNNIICISQSVKNLGVKEKIFSDSDVTVIGQGSSNGVDLDYFNSDSLDQDKLDRLRVEWLEEDCFYFGFIGRIVERKGVKELFESFQEVYSKNEKVRLLVVGKPYFDQLDEAFFNMFISHPGVEYVGLVPFDEVAYYFNLIDVFVLPAHWEGFGNVLIQAAALGKPIISTNSTGCKDAVSDGFNGELIEIGDISMLSETMTKFTKSAELLRKYGRNGILWSKNFQSKRVWEGLKELYEMSD